MAAKLSAGRNRTNPSPTSPRKQISMRAFFQPPGLVILTGPLLCFLSTALLLSFILPLTLLQAFSLRIQKGDAYSSFHYKKKNTTSCLGAVVSSCANSLWVDKVATEATSNEIHAEWPMNIWNGLWSNTRRGREAFSGWREGGKTRVCLNIRFNYMWLHDTEGP